MGLELNFGGLRVHQVTGHVRSSNSDDTTVREGVATIGSLRTQRLKRELGGTNFATMTRKLMIQFH